MTKDLILDSKTLNDKIMALVKEYDVNKILPDMSLVGAGQIEEVKNTSGRPNLYYQWLACLMKLVQPAQVVELGAAAGISTMMMASEMPIDSRLYSVDIDPTLGWKWMSKEYPQVVKILGDDLNMAIWPGNVDLGKTDVWFLDALHTYKQLSAELELYKPYFKKGAILVFDDIQMSELRPIWEALPYDKFETSDFNHYSGFGHMIV